MTDQYPDTIVWNALAQDINVKDKRLTFGYQTVSLTFSRTVRQKFGQHCHYIKVNYRCGTDIHPSFCRFLLHMAKYTFDQGDQNNCRSLLMFKIAKSPIYHINIMRCIITKFHFPSTYRILWATNYSKYLINPDKLFNKLVQCKLSSFLILKIDEGHNERQSAAR